MKVRILIKESSGVSAEPQFQIVPVYDEEDWELIEQAEQLFKEAKIRLASYENPALVATIQDKVVGALFGGQSENSRGEDGEFAITVRFSAVTSPKVQRKGIWRALATRFVKDTRNNFGADDIPVKLEAWVVNPNTIPVLESLGFVHSDGGDWSPGSPFYEKWL